MAEAEPRDMEILLETAARVERLEAQALDIRKEIAAAVKEGELRAQLVLMNAPELAERIPARYKPRSELADTVPSLSAAPPTPRSQVPNEQPGKRAGKTQRVSHREMVEWCTQILREHGGVMHVSQIKEELEKGTGNGWRVPGQGTDSNVSVHLARSDAFESTGERGVWRLADRGGA